MIANKIPTIANTIKLPMATPYTLMSSTLFSILNAVSDEKNPMKKGMIVFIERTNAAKTPATVGFMKILL